MSDVVIESLTDEQVAQLPGLFDEWLKIALCTDTIDQEKAKAAVTLAYECAELAPPPEFKFFESPIAMIKDIGLPLSDVNVCYGSVDSSWLSAYDVFIKFGLQLDIIKGLIETAKTCGWWVPFDTVCYISDRPCGYHFEDGLLHNEDGPSIKYRDGFSVWSIDGVRVDEQIVMRPETQTVEQIINEANEEVKSIRINRFGWSKYLRETGAALLDKRENLIEHTEEALFQIDDTRNVLVCVCPSTGKLFSLEVTSEQTTCEEAQLFLSGGHSARIISAS